MRNRTILWIARLLLAVTAFSQASIAFADCPAERAGLAHALAAEKMEGCESAVTAFTQSGPQNANRCVAHCTADLQIPVAPVAIVRAPSHAPVLLLPHAGRVVFRQTGLESPAPGTPPSRILLHSYLI